MIPIGGLHGVVNRLIIIKKKHESDECRVADKNSASVVVVEDTLPHWLDHHTCCGMFTNQFAQLDNRSLWHFLHSAILDTWHILKLGGWTRSSSCIPTRRVLSDNMETRYSIGHSILPSPNKTRTLSKRVINYCIVTPTSAHIKKLAFVDLFFSCTFFMFLLWSRHFPGAAISRQSRSTSRVSLVVFSARENEEGCLN